MQIRDDRLEGLRRICKEASDEEITLAEAREMAQRLMTLYQILARPLPGESQALGGNPKG
jgi:hypothetical protein